MLCIVVLILYIVLAEIIEIKRVDFIHESGVAVFLGILIGLMIKYGLNQTVAFSESSLFYFILPPIIFSAGYTLKKQNFIENFSYILMFGLFGTLLCMMFLSYLIVGASYIIFTGDSAEMMPNQYDCMLLAIML